MKFRLYKVLMNKYVTLSELVKEEIIVIIEDIKI